MTIEEVSLPKIELSNLPKSPAQLLPRAKAAAGFAGLAVQPYPSLPGFEDVKGRINLENGVLTATGVQGRMGPLSLPDLNIRVSRLDGRPKVAVQAKGPVQLAATSDEKVEDLLKRYGLKSLVVSAHIDMHGDFDETLHEGWIADGSLDLAGVRAETYPEGVVMDNVQGRVTVKRRKRHRHHCRKCQGASQSSTGSAFRQNPGSGNTEPCGRREGQCQASRTGSSAGTVSRP